MYIASVHSRRVKEPGEFEQTFRDAIGLDLEIAALGSEFDGQIRGAVLERTGMIRFDSSGIRIRSSPLDHVALSICTDQAFAVEGEGESYEAGTGHILDVGEPFHARSSKFGAFVVVLDRRLIEEHGADLGYDVGALEQPLPTRIDFGRPRAQLLRGTASVLWSTLEGRPPYLASQIATAELEEQLAHAFIRAVGIPRAAKSDATDPREQAVVARAVDYIHSHLAAPIRTRDLVAAVGASTSTIGRAFRLQLGVSPMVYVQQRRLLRARDLLLAGSPETHSVTRIALDLGFNHLGQFSADYRRRFGEAPSASLRGPAR